MHTRTDARTHTAQPPPTPRYQDDNRTIWVTDLSQEAVCLTVDPAFSSEEGGGVSTIPDRMASLTTLSTLSRHTLPTENLLVNTDGLLRASLGGGTIRRGADAIHQCSWLLLTCALLMTSSHSKAIVFGSETVGCSDTMLDAADKRVYVGSVAHAL